VVAGLRRAADGGAATGSLFKAASCDRRGHFAAKLSDRVRERLGVSPNHLPGRFCDVGAGASCRAGLLAYGDQRRLARTMVLKLKGKQSTMRFATLPVRGSDHDPRHARLVLFAAAPVRTELPPL